MAQAESARSALRENEIQLAQARITFNRAAELLKGGAGTQADVDLARSDMEAKAARLDALRQQIAVADRQVELQQTELSNTVVRAPFSGMVISKDAQPGEMVSPVSAGGGFTRTGICTIVDMRSLEIDVDVNESYINRVRPGQAVTAVLDAYPDWQIPAHVITTVPTADRQKATVLVRIAFEEIDPRVLPDMGVKVIFLRDPDEGDAALAANPVALVPKAAVQAAGDGSIVFVVSGNVAERRAVRVGGGDGDRVEIVAGVRPGERVVVSPPQGLSDGSPVEVR
jgi:RND family efflux transporter MFP subunit